MQVKETVPVPTVALMSEHPVAAVPPKVTTGSSDIPTIPARLGTVMVTVWPPVVGP